MPKKKAQPSRRSWCPLNASVEMLGDRWSLLIIRDMMIRGCRMFNEFLHSDEKIASNILADRLRRLESFGIIATKQDASDGRKVIYSLTAKGVVHVGDCHDASGNGRGVPGQPSWIAAAVPFLVVRPGYLAGDAQERIG